MVEGGKRSRNQRDNEGDNKFQKRKTATKEEGKNDELIVYRILCPDIVIGSVIGKSGKVINSIRQETRAKIKVVDRFPGSTDRVITIYCHVKDKAKVEVDDEYDGEAPLCAAQDALLRVHAAISNATNGDSDKKKKDNEEAHILAPTSQAANIIGKSGATIKKMRSKTKASIKVHPKDVNDITQSCALDFDNFVLITGEAGAVKKALYAVSAIMYKFSPKEQIPLESTIIEAPPSIIISSDVPIFPPSAGFYPAADTFVPPQPVSSFVGTTQHAPDLHRFPDMPVYPGTLPLIPSGHSENLVIKVLCPSNKIGRVIGKGGSSIKSVRQDTRAQVEVDDAKGNRDECLITVTATEAEDDVHSMAIDAVLLLQDKINDNDDGEDVHFRLLVPKKSIGSVIGKNGAIVNDIRKGTGADVRISKSKKPACADDSDELVEVIGHFEKVRNAIIQVILRLRDDVLKDRDGGRDRDGARDRDGMRDRDGVRDRDGGRDKDGGRDRDGARDRRGHDYYPHADSVYSSGAGLSVHPGLPTVPSVAPYSYDHRVDAGSGGYNMLSSSSLYGYEPAADSYGLSSYSSKAYAGLATSNTAEITIPGHAVGKVMGRGGANVANIRKISGASVDVSESKSSRGDRVAVISGTEEQKRSAENLIHAFIMAT